MILVAIKTASAALSPTPPLKKARSARTTQHQPTPKEYRRTTASRRKLPLAGSRSNFRFTPRLCEKSREPRKRRIVFSIAVFRPRLPVQLVSVSMKLRQIFYTQIERRTFHTACPESRLNSENAAFPKSANCGHPPTDKPPAENLPIST
jgi:hypothetical protein